MDSVIALFDHYSNLEWAIEVLEEYGVDGDRISLVARDDDTLEAESAAAGTNGATGMANGALSGLLTGLSAFVVPGLGPVIATGSLASALFITLGTTAAGAGLGASRGGLPAALVDLGLSKDDAEYYAEGVRQGRILVYVETDLPDEYRIRAILRGAGAVHVNTRPQVWQIDGWAGFDETERTHQQTVRH